MVTGSNGQLGKELRQLAPAFPQFEFIFLSREDLPVNHFKLVNNFFDAWHPDYCINCAAYMAVDRAETEKDLAFLVNAEAVGVLADICKRHQTHFIHFSTDYVFNGKGDHPYREDDLTDPINLYGESKCAGENEAFSKNPESIVIRTSWVYSEFGKNFVKTIWRLLREKTEISVVDDQLGSPTYAADLASATMHIISSGKWQPGIYHYSNKGVISWFEFANAIKEIAGISSHIKPVPTSEYPTPARRPAYSVLDKTKIQRVYHVNLKDWRESLSDCVTRLK